jgi:hypothetical protein
VNNKEEFMTRKTTAIARGVGAISAVVALVVGVTFAAQTSSVTLSDNTIGVGSADLLISNTPTSGFGSNVTGFQDNALVPGTPSSPYTFYLDNVGPTSLALSLTTDLTSNKIPAGLDPSKIQGQLFLGGSGTPAATFTLKDLENASTTPVTSNSTNYLLPAGTTEEAQVEWTAEPGADTGSGGDVVSPFTITITGTVPNS